MNFIFFYECNKYEELRNKYFNRNWLRNISLNMFYSIMNLKDNSSVVKVSNYLVEAFKLRQSLIADMYD